MTRSAFVFATVALAVVAGVAGCQGAPVDESSPYISLYAEESEEIIGAATSFGATRNAGAIPHLIATLEHEDMWVRSFAHNALLLITGNRIRHGFAYNNGPAARKGAVAAWRAWYKEEGRTLYPPSHDESRS